jgi:hypothetical protein
MALTKIQSLGITDGTIVNADINASAAIAGSKLTGAGKLLQVVSATDSTQRSTTSSSFVTGSNTLSVSITPSSASNKVFIIIGAPVRGDYTGYLTVYRGATDLGASSSKGLCTFLTEVGVAAGSFGSGVSYLDSPSTTSATTYQVYFRTTGGTAYINFDNCKSSITVMEIGA